MQKKQGLREKKINAIATGNVEALETLRAIKRGEKVVLSTFLEALIFTSWPEKDQESVEVEVAGEWKEILERIEANDQNR